MAVSVACPMASHGADKSSGRSGAQDGNRTHDLRITSALPSESDEMKRIEVQSLEAEPNNLGIQCDLLQGGGITTNL